MKQARDEIGIDMSETFIICNRRVSDSIGFPEKGKSNTRKMTTDNLLYYINSEVGNGVRNNVIRSSVKEIIENRNEKK